MSKHIPVTILALAFACAVASAAAQDTDKTLYWRRLDVVAHLDAAGRLRVRERQTMVFTGDWNGGSRTFDIRPGQHHEFYSISRIDAAGTAHRLTAGNIDQVDHFEWSGAKTLRWRSRLPSDPPFANQEIVYEIDYALTNILIPTRNGYKLDHDFAFPDRDGIIESFSLDFDVDPAWQSATSLPLHLERQSIPPGSSVVVKMPLGFSGIGTPGAVQRGVPLLIRVLLVLTLLGGFAWLLRAFFASESARGRFAPLTPVATIDRAWLREHVFSIAPEVVGAAWDTTTGAPEVAAMIARMVLEGKLASRVEPHKRKQILHLELKVARATLSHEERKLVNALFADGETETDTEKIRKRYRKKGFDPAALIRAGIQKQVTALLPSEGSTASPRNVLQIVVIVMIVVAATIAAFVLAGGGPLLLAPIVAVVAGIMAVVLAATYRVSVVDTKQKAWRFVLLLLIGAAPILAVMLGLFEAGAALSIAPVLVAARPSVPLLIDLIVLFLGITLLVLRAARTREAPARLELRRKLAAARAYLARELKQKQPALEDDWYPYLMAFGLGSHIDQWFRAFGPTVQEPAIFATSSSLAAATSSSTGWSGGGPLFGGGGGFGGGGAGRTWASAAQTFSAGVASPSSGGSSGGGGGGGSSGGGGGGGW